LGYFSDFFFLYLIFGTSGLFLWILGFFRNFFVFSVSDFGIFFEFCDFFWEIKIFSDFCDYLGDFGAFFGIWGYFWDFGTFLGSWDFFWDFREGVRRFFELRIPWEKTETEMVRH